MTAFPVFAALWAIATLFHIGSYGWWDTSLLAALAAVWLLARPSSVYRFVLFSTIQLGDVWFHLPQIPNHWLIAASVDLLILLSYARLVASRRRLRIDGDELLATFAAPVRLVVVIVYAYTFVHKLNWDFLSVEVSCASAFHAAYANAYPFVPEGPSFRLFSIVATLVLEALIPILLCFGRTRALGVLVGLLFHQLLSFNPISSFYNFSAMMIALYVLFVPEELVTRIATQWGPSSWAERTKRWARVAKDLPFVAFVLVEIVVLLLAYLFWDLPSRRLFFFLWLPYSGAAIALYIVYAERWSGEAPGALIGLGRGAFRVSSRAHLVVPVLVLLNGLAPYLGLKTETSFAMYSNLRTEGGRSNHLLIPGHFQLFDYQRDLAEIVSSSDRRMQRQADIDRYLTFFELRRHMSEHPDERIHYIRHYIDADGGRGSWEKELARARDDPELTMPHPLLLSKLLYFRDVIPGERQRCVH